MSKTKNWLMDMEDEFYSKADKVIGGCECFGEFADAMKDDADKVEWTLDTHNGETFEVLLHEMWGEKWSKYATN